MASVFQNMTFQGGLRGKLDPFGITKRLFGKGGDEGPVMFSGERPFSGAEVGLGAEQLKPISERFAQQIGERSQGQGLVGFDPARSTILKDQLRMELADREADLQRQQSSQASSQGLRGGVPMTISQQRQKDVSRALGTGLATIDVNDLEARRADINQATFAQPGLVQLGAGIQNQRAGFDLAEFEGSNPLIQEQPDNTLSQILGLAGTAAGAYFGGPAGASIGGQIGSTIGQASQSSQTNKSLSPGRINTSNPAVSNQLQNFQFGQRRY